MSSDKYNIDNMDIELLLTVGAGDIDTMVKPIQELVG